MVSRDHIQYGQPCRALDANRHRASAMARTTHFRRIQCSFCRFRIPGVFQTFPEVVLILAKLKIIILVLLLVIEVIELTLPIE